MLSDKRFQHGFRPGFNDGTFGIAIAAILLVTAVTWASNSPNVEKADFSLTYVGATLVHTGFGARLYDINLQKETRDKLFQHPSPLLFEHPPFEALLFSPLARFSYRTAYLMWGLLNAVLWLILMVGLRRHLTWPREDLAYIILWLLFAPLGVALYQGQSSIILLAVFAGSFLLSQQGKNFEAGLLLGLGLVKLQFVLPLLLIFLLRKKWTLAGGFVITALCLSLLSLAAVGWQGAVDYGKLLLAVGSNPQNVSYGSGVDMPTIHGLVFAIGRTWLSSRFINALAAGLSLFLVVWVGLRWSSLPSPVSSRLMFASAIPASLVAGSPMFTHAFSPLLLAMFIAAAELRNLPTFIWRRILIGALLIFWTFPIYFLLVAWHALFIMCPVLLLFAWATAKSAAALDQHGADRIECAVIG